LTLVKQPPRAFPPRFSGDRRAVRMPGNPAAIAAVARRRKEALANERRKQKAESKAKVDKWFEKFDTNGSGVLERDQLKALFTSLNPSGEEPGNEAIDMAMEKAISLDTTGDGKADTMGISRHSAEIVVDKYSNYMKEKTVLDAVFKEFDYNNSGILEPDQLLGLLNKVSPDTTVGDEDVEYILSECDKDGKGGISRSEVLSACATWKMAVQRKQDGKAACCIVM